MSSEEAKVKVDQQDPLNSTTETQNELDQSEVKSNTDTKSDEKSSRIHQNDFKSGQNNKKIKRERTEYIVS